MEMIITEAVFICALGGVLYGLIELLWRGFTHWTMVLCGGLCFLMMYLINTVCRKRLRKLTLCAAAVTLIEFFTGCIVNIMLGWQVWDYSDRPGNILGQICPLFTLFWFLLSIPGTALCSRLRKRLSVLFP